MEILSCHNDESTRATVIKILFLEANDMKSSASFFFFFFFFVCVCVCKFDVLVVMATNQIKRFVPNSY